MVKNLPANAGDTVSIPRSGRLPREGNGNPLQDSCLGNPMDRGASRATVRGVAKVLRHDLATTDRNCILVPMGFCFACTVLTHTVFCFI